MRVQRIFQPRPPLAIHFRYRRIYGDSGYMRSVTRVRLRLVKKIRSLP
jgi:hypothetical protein